ncbi:myosin regulatory light chain 12A-like [Argiope bruennichi]|uniref:Myosin regulatory light polypeptide 9 like protein n=1 Tax=Argiope bruennichi TaxID=94029 RepID=A0A8T0F0S7_ARGBR|nr:myosin regulatory light chain 12A-like [Argiope bruennichi]KAF8784744.1 Myosin regulatory light polypeptide 9 like protein [Argiope bruennichi]
MGDEDKKEKKKKSKKKSAQETDASAECETVAVDETPSDPVPIEQPIITAPPTMEKKSSTKRKAHRCGSNVFAMFTQRKVQEFKEAFQLIDQDKDGFITKSDLKITFDLLGREVDDEDLQSMLAEAPGPLNFTMFLTIFGERISGTDEEDVILSAFSIFDEGDGKMKEEVLKNTLRKRGDKFTDEEADICLKEAPVDKEGYISIRRFTQILTKGDEDDDTDGG